MILAIDPGKIHIGVCGVDDDDVIARWELWTLDRVDARDVLRVLSAQPFDGVTHVVIERQPSKNPSMTRLQHYLEMFFTIRGIPVALQDSKHKLLYASTTPWFPTAEESTAREWTYRFRKKLSVLSAAAFVRGTRQALAHVFDASKKKDDLADALWHALAYRRFRSVDSSVNSSRTNAAPTSIAATSVRPRKPTEKQRRTKRYSASNVAWFLRQGVDPDTDAALAAAMRRHGIS